MVWPLAAGSASGQVFELGEKYYRHVDSIWYTYNDGRLGDRIIPHRVIVRKSSGSRVTSADLLQVGVVDATIESRAVAGEYYVIVVDKNKNPFTVAQALRVHPLFDYVGFDALGYFLASPDDPRYISGEQWNLDMIDVPEAWNITSGMNVVTLAIIDQGVDYNHEDLYEAIWQNLGEDDDGDGYTLVQDGSGKWTLDPGDKDNGTDSDGNGYIDDLIGWNTGACVSAGEDCSGSGSGNGSNDYYAGRHGTRVAGIAAAKTYNGMGIAGIAGGWSGTTGIDIMPIKVRTLILALAN